MRRQKRERSVGRRLESSSAGGKLERPLSCALCRRRSRRPPSLPQSAPQSDPAWRQTDRRSPRSASSALSMKATVSARGSRTPNTTARRTDLIFQGHSLADQLLARADQRADGGRGKRLHMHGLEEACAEPSQMRQPSRVIAIGLVGRQRLERLIGLPAPPRRPRADRVGSARGTRSAPFAPSRIRCDRQLGALASSLATACAVDFRLALTTTHRLRGRERKHASRPSRYRGQQNSRFQPSPLRKFRFSPILSAFVEESACHYPMLKNSDFRFDHNSEDRWQPRWKIPWGFGGRAAFAACDAPICLAVATTGLDTAMGAKTRFSRSLNFRVFNIG